MGSRRQARDEPASPVDPERQDQAHRRHRRELEPDPDRVGDEEVSEFAGAQRKGGASELEDDEAHDRHVPNAQQLAGTVEVVPDHQHHEASREKVEVDGDGDRHDGSSNGGAPRTAAEFTNSTRGHSRHDSVPAGRRGSRRSGGAATIRGRRAVPE